MIFYTLQHQQLKWNNNIYLLKQGIPTGAKHSVPLANIFLTYIMRTLLQTNQTFNNIFNNNIVLWKRFIDDGGGISRGNIEYFMYWNGILKEHFRKFELELTADTDSHSIDGNNYTLKDSSLSTYLDIDIYKSENNMHTKEHRKETSTTTYLKYTSAHAKYTFKGIMKSQLQRIRRLCSRQSDYVEAVEQLKQRCAASGYKAVDIEAVFTDYENIPRTLDDHTRDDDDDDTHKVPLVTLAGTPYSNDIKEFATRMNRVLSSSKIEVQIVSTTGPSLAKSLFSNNGNVENVENCGNCILCRNNAINTQGTVRSTVTGKTYNIARNLACTNGGIYVYGGPCDDQYSGKTTVFYSKRTDEHLRLQKTSSVYKHREKCRQCSGTSNFSMSLVEDYKQRGKYTLSEREYLWNYRIKGVINDHKTLAN